MSKILLRLISLFYIISNSVGAVFNAVAIIDVFRLYGKELAFNEGLKLYFNSYALKISSSVVSILLFISLFLITFIKDDGKRKTSRRLVSVLQAGIPLAVLAIGYIARGLLSVYQAKTHIILPNIGVDAFLALLCLLNISLAIICLIWDSRERKALKAAENAENN